MSATKVKKSEAKGTTAPFSCVVASDRMDKSRVAYVESLVKHPRYSKYVKRRTKIMFHDEQNSSKKGDQVLVVQTRPLSANKRFSLLKVVRKQED